jgi:MEDS: MEthanogen/methylotroph, DcmR Sensory domain
MTFEARLAGKQRSGRYRVMITSSVQWSVMPSQDDQLALGAGQHAVQFYGVDSELAGSVARYLGAGLRAGDPVVIVATAPHRVAFEAGLTALGVGAGVAREQERLLMLDAAGTLGGLFTGDKLDPDRFDATIGALLRKVAIPGHTIRIYAEMVALLWDEGRVFDALELERLWNEMGARHPFSLLCGYSAQLLTERGHAEAAAEVCSLHSSVVDSQPYFSAAGASAVVEIDVPVAEAIRRFPAVRTAAREARHFVVDTLLAWGQAGFADDAAIVTAELAANAVLHARSPFTVVVSRCGDCLKIAVKDTGPLLSAYGDTPLTVRQGHGLAVVAKIARRWAVDPVPQGKAVWAELSPPRRR